MKYAALVARREYVENAKTKGFWIGILTFPLVLILMIQVPVWLEKKGTPTRYFALVDQSGGMESLVLSTLGKSYQRQVKEARDEYTRKNPLQSSNQPPSSVPPFKLPRRIYERVDLPPGLKTNAPLAELVNDLKPYLRGEKKIFINGQPAPLYAAILIPPGLDQLIVRPASTPARPAANGIEYWSIDVTDAGFGLRQQVEQAIDAEIRQREFLAHGVDAAAVRQIEQTYVAFTALSPKKEAGREAVNSTDVIRQWAPSAFVYLLWVSTFMIVQMLLTNIIEEKSNRIIEVLLSSVTPGELMMGKLFGIAAIGLTMVGAWMATVFIVLELRPGGSGDVGGQVLAVLQGSHLVLLFAVYFLLGYLMYAAVILALGSVCNTLKDAQSYMGVITMLMMLPLMTMTFIPKDPNGPIARLLSWIPLYSPFIMMNRANADPPLVDLIGTLVLQVVCMIGALWMAGKIFRIGILRTGQPPKIVEMLKWLKRS